MGIAQSDAGQATGSSPFNVTLPTPPPATSAVVVFIQGNSLVSTPSGWTLREDEVNNQGHYLFERDGDGSTSSWEFQASFGGALVNWSIHEVENGAFDIDAGANSPANVTSYATPNLTPSAGERVILASVGSLRVSVSGTVEITSWTNSFAEVSDTSHSSADGPQMGVAAREVTADGSTAYGTTATWPATVDDASAIIVAYETSDAPTSVTSTRSTTWDTRTTVASSRATPWDVRQAVAGSRATSWDTRQAVTSNRTTPWDVLAATQSQRPTSWDVRAAVLSQRTTIWDALQAIPVPRSTSWDTRQAITSGRSTGWDVHAIGTVTSQRSTLWDTRATAASQRAAGWDVRTATAAQRATIWDTRQRTTSARATSWDVASDLVAPTVPPARVTVVLAEDRTTRVAADDRTTLVHAH